MTEQEMQDQVAEVQAKADKFQRLHADGVIEHELRKAAEEAGAFNPDQILMLLKGKSRLVDANGKQAVRVVSVDDDGKEVHHSPAQAVWHMKQTKDNFNFFLETMAATSTQAPPAKIDPKTDLRKLLENMPFEDYLKLRKEHPEVLGLKRLPNSGR